MICLLIRCAAIRYAAMKIKALLFCLFAFVCLRHLSFFHFRADGMMLYIFARVMLMLILIRCASWRCRRHDVMMPLMATRHVYATRYVTHADAAAAAITMP